MKWRKGTEISDSHAADLHWRWADSKKPIHQSQHISLGKLELTTNAFKSIKLEMIEWLHETDESPSPTDESALEKEAEELYPFPTVNKDDFITLVGRQNLRRHAYIEGRRKTIEQKDEEVEALKAEAIEYSQQVKGLLEKVHQTSEELREKDGEIERLRAEVASLQKELEQFLQWIVSERVYRRDKGGWYAAEGERFLCATYPELIEVFRNKNNPHNLKQ